MTDTTDSPPGTGLTRRMLERMLLAYARAKTATLEAAPRPGRGSRGNDPKTGTARTKRRRKRGRAKRVRVAGHGKDCRCAR